MGRRFPLGVEFPAEGFIQQALENHFASLGYELLDEGHTDLACTNPQTGDRWIIEAKGHSSSIGLDFNTCLGQLLKRMHDDENSRFGLAVPDTPPYHRQLQQISHRVRRALRLHWLLIESDASVTIIEPDQSLPMNKGGDLDVTFQEI